MANFIVKEIDPKKLIEYIDACKINEDPEVRVITAHGLMLSEIPPRIPLDGENEDKYYRESGRKSPCGWRLEDDGDDFNQLSFLRSNSRSRRK